jgi:hypothetical protein
LKCQHYFKFGHKTKKTRFFYEEDNFQDDSWCLLNNLVRIFIQLLLLLLLILPCIKVVSAFDLVNERVRISGFGTLGVTSAGKKQFGYHKELNHDALFGEVSIFADSVFGLQLDANLLPNLSATIQAIAEERVQYDFNNIVDWAYLSYQVTPNTVVRAGRMGIDLFMLSEYRNVGFAYLWTHPVIEFYTPISLSHYDGFDLKYTRKISPGYLEFKVYGGQTGSDIRVSRGDLNLRMRPFMGANVTFESDDWKVRLVYATTEVSSIRSQLDPLLGTLNSIPQSIWPQATTLSGILDGVNERASFYSAGFAYDNNKWLIQSEFALMASDWPSVNMTNGYLSIGRRMGPVAFYTIGAYAKSRDNLTKVAPPLISSPALNQLQTITQNVLNAPRINQNSISLGLRWDLHSQIALKAQWDHTWVRKHGGGLLILKEPLEKDITLNTFSLNLNFVF